jgi:hypothetical protein
MRTASVPTAPTAIGAPRRTTAARRSPGSTTATTRICAIADATLASTIPVTNGKANSELALARCDSDSVAAVDDTSPAKNPAIASPRVGPRARTAM